MTGPGANGERSNDVAVAMTPTPRYTLHLPVTRAELRWLHEAATIRGMALEEYVRGELHLSGEEEPLGRPHLKLVDPKRVGVAL